MPTFGCHDLLKTVPFDEQLSVALLASTVIFVLDVDDSTSDSRNTLISNYQTVRPTAEKNRTHFHHNVRQQPLEFTQPIIFFLTIDINS